MKKKYDFGILQEYFDDPEVSEIMVNGPDRIFIERSGKKSMTNVSFKTDDNLENFLKKMLAPTGKKADQQKPYADACLDDGTRINVIIPPVARSGIAVTIRKLSDKIKSIDDLIKNGTIPQNVADFLIACVKGKINIIFSGGTGVGKTTTLQVLTQYFSPDERVVTVEDTAELRIEQKNIVSLETKDRDSEGEGTTIRDLIRNTLRMSPDRIVIGEIRGGEAVDMIQAMATGHNGTIGVMHGNSPQDVISRLETMMLMSGVNLPHSEIRKLISSTINLIVHQEKIPGGQRRVTQITEIQGMERSEIIFNDLFSYQNAGVDPNGKTIRLLKACQRSYPLFYRRFQDQGLFTYNVFST